MSSFENDPFRSPTHSPSGDGGRGLIMAVAVINYVFGGLSLACGICAGAFGGSVIGLAFAAIRNDPQVDPDAKFGMGIMSVVIVAIAGIQVLSGVLILLAGYGVQNYREWGRILTIVLAVISGVIGLLSLLLLWVFGLLQIGYAIFTLIVLLNPSYTRDFR
ncbi:hypothetical protein [Blastopirellula marina]|nr:hypothetical protein [Blastopirellula marina]